jgi:dTMP kinase
MTGLFVTFEGIEGSGKTTQIHMAAAYLESRRIPCLATSEPGGSNLGRTLRKLLLEKSGLRISARSELLLFAADRAQHVEEIICPALQEGRVVLCDRFADATTVYQGYGRGLDLDMIDRINDFAAQSLRPGITVLFDMSPERGLDRVRRRDADSPAGPDDRFEVEHIEFHRRVREGYLTLAEQDPQRFRVVDADRDIDAVFSDVVAVLEGVLGE